jgi:hypothetical protein
MWRIFQLRTINCVYWKWIKQNNNDSGYKLRLTALLQYLRLVNYQEPKIKASFCIAQQINKRPYFAYCLRVWEKWRKDSNLEYI